MKSKAKSSSSAASALLSHQSSLSDMNGASPQHALLVGGALTSIGAVVWLKGKNERVLTAEEVISARRRLGRLNPDYVDGHLSNLKKHGVSVVTETLARQDRDQWKAKLEGAFRAGGGVTWNSGRAHYSINKRHDLYHDLSRVGGIGEYESNLDRATDGNLSSWTDYFRTRSLPAKSTTGTAPNGTNSRRITLEEIVQSYFAYHGIKRYEITDAQFLNAYPSSTNQIWHRDNKFKGLTAIIALDDVTSNGCTELLVGTHMCDTLSSLIRWSLSSTSEDSDGIDACKVLLGCLDAGDAILYDARVMHRGRGNNCPDERERPVLVLRWDATRTPPPGCGLIVTTANVYLGKIMYAILIARGLIS